MSPKCEVVELGYAVTVVTRHAHPFDRYGEFTDVAMLKEWSGRPLRKSVRVNTLKCTVARLREWAMERGWNLEPVPWCKEGFFIDRADRGEALGRDLLHFIGGFYMQEAASMLPVELLNPRPGDTVLDLSAAPGSKTTQIAAKMGGVGVLVANDVQEKRLWILKSALHRCGVTNVIVTKKVGQWFGRHMTERFDRVLIDAPCTAQGTLRKDSDALEYCGKENVEKMARLQYQLLEAAVHATKVGGHIVYSTCTLTPEENEGVIMNILNTFFDQLEVVDPRRERLAESDKRLGEIFDRAIGDSIRVQEWLLRGEKLPLTAHRLPLVRLWPQTYDTEGFFCAILKKVAPTRTVEDVKRIPFQEAQLSSKHSSQVARTLEDHYRTTFLREGECLMGDPEGALVVTNDEVASFPLPTKDFALGLPFAKVLPDDRVRIAHEMATLLGSTALQHVVDVDEEGVAMLLKGKNIHCKPDLSGDVLLFFQHFCVGHGLAQNGVLKNNLPRWMILS